MNAKPLSFLFALALACTLLAGCQTVLDATQARTAAPFEPTALIIADEDGPLTADELALRRPAIISYLVNRGYLDTPNALVDNPAAASRFIRVILSAGGGFRITEFTLGNRARRIVTSSYIPGHADSYHYSSGYGYYSSYVNQPYYYEPPVVYTPPPPYTPPKDRNDHPDHDYRPRDNDNRNHSPRADRREDPGRHYRRGDDGRDRTPRDHDSGSGRNWSGGHRRDNTPAPAPAPPPAPSYSPPPRNDPPPPSERDERIHGPSKPPHEP